MVRLVVDETQDSRWVFIWDEDKQIEVIFELFDIKRTHTIRSPKPFTRERFEEECLVYVGELNKK